MRSVDTNVVARFLLGDDQDQSAVARGLVAEGVFVPVTVLLETAWLLSSRYGFDRRDTVALIQQLVDLPTVIVADAHLLRWALTQAAAGGDIADLLHVALSGEATTFATFDRGILHAAGPDAPVEIEILA